MITSEVFSCFVLYAMLLVFKIHMLSLLTVYIRLSKKAYANPEDAMRQGGLQYYRMDPYVERCRRAHLNDLENIIPFLFVGAIYTMISPDIMVARIHFIVFFLGRVLHTIAYLFALRAPVRSVAYAIGQVSCFSMGVQILMEVMAYA